jgi:uncharacterized protein (TIGR03435 family)
MHRVAVCVLMAAPLIAQAPSAVLSDLRFEVASLKPSLPGARGGGIRPAEGAMRYVANNYPIKGMIMVAYRVRADQIVGGPLWLDTDRYDMEAKAEKPSTPDELHTMLMNMLVDRMQLKFHLEQREMRRYTLTVGKDGPKMTPHELQTAHDPWVDLAQEKPLHFKFTATAAPMQYAAFHLSQLVDRPVVDMTGLKGGYDFTFSFTRDLPPGFPEGGKINGEDPDTSGPDIFQAVKQQLGLELKPDKGPVQVIVIDHVEKPTAN